MSIEKAPPERLAFDEPSTAELFREALDEAKELARVEIELAKSEVEMELARAKRAAIGIGIGIAAGLLVLCLLAMALVLAVGGTALAALVVAGAVLVIGGVASAIARASTPRGRWCLTSALPPSAAGVAPIRRACQAYWQRIGTRWRMPRSDGDTLSLKCFHSAAQPS